MRIKRLLVSDHSEYEMFAWILGGMWRKVIVVYFAVKKKDFGLRLEFNSYRVSFRNNWSPCIPFHNEIKMYGGKRRHCARILKLGTAYSCVQLGAYLPEERFCGPNWVGNWVSPSAGSGDIAKSRIPVEHSLPQIGLRPIILTGVPEEDFESCRRRWRWMRAAGWRL
jgi:hypothetical protein